MCLLKRICILRSRTFSQLHGEKARNVGRATPLQQTEKRRRNGDAGTRYGEVLEGGEPGTALAAGCHTSYTMWFLFPAAPKPALSHRCHPMQAAKLLPADPALPYPSPLRLCLTLLSRLQFSFWLVPQCDTNCDSSHVPGKCDGSGICSAVVRLHKAMPASDRCCSTLLLMRRQLGVPEHRVLLKTSQNSAVGFYVQCVCVGQEDSSLIKHRSSMPQKFVIRFLFESNRIRIQSLIKRQE